MLLISLILGKLALWSLGLNHDETICENLNLIAARASLVPVGPKLVGARGQENSSELRVL